ncbi:MAG: glycosyltransferase family 1 protein [Gemmataceae bacterium]
MRIGIDACCWSNCRGFGRYTRELVTTLVRQYPEHEFVLVADRPTAEQSNFPPGAAIVPVATRQQMTHAASAASSRGVGDLLRLGRAAAAVRADAFLFPAVYSYYPLLGRTPCLIVFHDAIAEQHPGLIFAGRRARLFWAWKTWLARRQASVLATVSQDARRQVAAAFGYPEEKIRVITEGPGDGIAPLDDSRRVADARRRYGLPADTPLILYVGGISPHKNLQGLARALAAMPPAAGPWHLVLVGEYRSDSFLSCYRELTGLFRELALTDRVSFTGFVPEDDLAALYSAATMLVLPSFAEGFGLPVVEAMACGLPVAASRRGSLPEVLGGAGLLFDPADPAAIAGCVIRLLSDSSLRVELRRLGLERAANYSWRTAARQAMELFEEMAPRARRTA